MQTGKAFPHAMLREIYEQPDALTRALEAYVDGAHPNEEAFGPALAALARASEHDELLIAASGSSRHAGLAGKVMLAELAGITVDVQYASEYIGQKLRLSSPACCLVLSQSGETADTLEAMRKAQADGVSVLAVTNQEASTMAASADAYLPIHAGPEKAIPATKSFTGQLLVLYLLAVAAGQRRGRLSPADAAARLDQARRLPGLLRSSLETWEAQLRSWIDTLSEVQTFLLLGRDIHFPIASEGALKLKESAYVQAEGYPAGELKHGPNALVSPDVMLIVLATRDPHHEGSMLRYGKTLQLLQDLQTQRARVTALVSADDQLAPSLCEHALVIPAASELLLPVLEVVPLQLLAYLLSVARGIDVDHPRNLVKSVTRE